MRQATLSDVIAFLCLLLDTGRIVSPRSCVGERRLMVHLVVHFERRIE